MELRLSSRVINIDDLRRIARRRLPPVVFAYLDGRADGEVTLKRLPAYLRRGFRPQQAVSIAECSCKLAFEFQFIVPRFSRGWLQSHDAPGGEVAASAAAGSAGTAYILSPFRATN